MARQIQTEYILNFVYDTFVPSHILWHSERINQMRTISKEYLLLFNAVTDAEESLRQLRETLVAVQQQAEELFMEETDPVEQQKPK